MLKKGGGGVGVADIFLSYKREQRAQVVNLAEALRGLGLEVWFDASLSAGEAFSDEINREVREARAIVVCWSPEAAESPWVKAEAQVGFSKRNLTSILIAGPDGFEAPVPFNSLHSEDMRDWSPTRSPRHAGWLSIVRRLGGLLGRADLADWGALAPHATQRQIEAWMKAHGETSPLIVEAEHYLTEREHAEAERRDAEANARRRLDLLRAAPSTANASAPTAHRTQTPHFAFRKALAPLAILIGIVSISLGAFYLRPDATQASTEEQSAWTDASTGGTPAELRSYLDNHPNGAHVTEARARLSAHDAARWERARSTNAREDIELYLEQFPDGAYAAAARDLLAAGDAEQALWERASASGAVSDLRRYLSRYPDGLHADEARQREARAEQAAWSRASGGEEGDIRAYLTTFPAGAHTSQAQAWLTAPTQPAHVSGPARLNCQGDGRAFVVYFEWDRHDLTATARAVIEQAIRESGPQSAIRIVGHSDTSHAPGYSLELSQRRARAVLDALVTLGASRARASLWAAGELEPPRPTADGVREPLNRAVYLNIWPSC